jgi:hypothetical protein
MSAKHGIWSDLQYVLLREEPGPSEGSGTMPENAKSFERCLDDLDWLLAMQSPDLSASDSD